MSILNIIQSGFTPLAVASYLGHKDVVAILLKANATPDIQEKVKHHNIIHKEYIESINFLSDAGA